MSTASLDILGVLVPPEDSAIPRAIEDLADKMASWNAAALAAIHASREGAISPATGDSPPAAREQVAGSDPSVPDLSAEDEALLDSAGREMAGLIRMRYCLFKGRKTIPEMILDEEEAMIGSLDEEAAKAVRVNHRLFNGRKSVFALIEEEEAKPKPPPRKKTWWKKGH